MSIASRFNPQNPGILTGESLRNAESYINELEIDRDLWKENANDWRVDAIRYRNALQDAATSFRKLSDDSYPGCEYRNGWMSYCNECWESAIETLEGKDVPD